MFFCLVRPGPGAQGRYPSTIGGPRSPTRTHNAMKRWQMDEACARMVSPRPVGRARMRWCDSLQKKYHYLMAKISKHTGQQSPRTEWLGKL
uniref:Uncharacterized protein n=1 Tax=Caenorhabditis japonica TaxID=281687 RepID=A0A8R1EDK5_CAEJA